MTSSNTSETANQISASNSDLETGYSSRGGIGLPSAYSLARVLDELSIAVILTDVNARVLHTNKSANEIIRTETGLKVADGHLKSGSDLDTIRLRQLINEAATNADDPVKQSRHFGMALGESAETELQSVVIAGLSSKGSDKRAGETQTAVFVARREHSDGIPNEILRGLFGLTLSEATVASRLLEGKGVEIAAKKSSIGVNTARSHLKKVFWKTRTGRQAELVRVLLRSVGFLRFD